MVTSVILLGGCGLAKLASIQGEGDLAVVEATLETSVRLSEDWE